MAAEDFIAIPALSRIPEGLEKGQVNSAGVSGFRLKAGMTVARGNGGCVRGLWIPAFAGMTGSGGNGEFNNHQRSLCPHRHPPPAVILRPPPSFLRKQESRTPVGGVIVGGEGPRRPNGKGLWVPAQGRNDGLVGSPSFEIGSKWRSFRFLACQGWTLADGKNQSASVRCRYRLYPDGVDGGSRSSTPLVRYSSRNRKSE